MTRAGGAVEDQRRVALVDLLDRVLAGGVVVSGDVTLAIADVDLVQISLRALISSISTLSGPVGPGQRAEIEPSGDD
ncbi:gas vesicle protein [Nocardia sp. NPDC055053]